MARPNSIVAVGKVRFGNALPLALIAGPCALESRAHAFEMAAALKEIAGAGRRRLRLQDLVRQGEPHQRQERARRRLDKALAIFAEIREKLGVPVLTDVHEPEQCAAVGAGRRCPADTRFPVPADRPPRRGRKDRPRHQREEGPVPRAVGHGQRGGENHRRRQCRRARHRARRLVRLQHARLRHAGLAGAGEDRRAGDLRRDPFGAAAGRAGHASGGEREFVPVLARAAVAVGVAGVFIETHQDPDRAPSDGPNMMPLKDMEPLLERLMQFDALAKGSPKPAVRA